MSDNPANTPPVQPPGHEPANLNPPPQDTLPPEDSLPPATPTSLPEDNEGMEERLERLGGEPAPAITPEEFARLQKAGQVHIDARGRVRTARRSDAEAGVSLRKRRAWYVCH